MTIMGELTAMVETWYGRCMVHCINCHKEIEEVTPGVWKHHDHNGVPYGICWDFDQEIATPPS
jgi:hypothetical protein